MPAKVRFSEDKVNGLYTVEGVFVGPGGAARVQAFVPKEKVQARMRERAYVSGCGVDDSALAGCDLAGIIHGINLTDHAAHLTAQSLERRLAAHDPNYYETNADMRGAYHPSKGGASHPSKGGGTYHPPKRPSSSNNPRPGSAAANAANAAAARAQATANAQNAAVTNYGLPSSSYVPVPPGASNTPGGGTPGQGQPGTTNPWLARAQALAAQRQQQQQQQQQQQGGGGTADGGGGGGDGGSPSSYPDDPYADAAEDLAMMATPPQPVYSDAEFDAMLASLDAQAGGGDDGGGGGAPDDLYADAQDDLNNMATAPIYGGGPYGAMSGDGRHGHARHGHHMRGDTMDPNTYYSMDDIDMAGADNIGTSDELTSNPDHNMGISYKEVLNDAVIIDALATLQDPRASSEDKLMAYQRAAMSGCGPDMMGNVFRKISSQVTRGSGSGAKRRPTLAGISTTSLEKVAMMDPDLATAALVLKLAKTGEARALEHVAAAKVLAATGDPQGVAAVNQLNAAGSKAAYMDDAPDLSHASMYDAGTDV